MAGRKTLWLAGLFAVLALALVACGGSDATATSSPLPTATISPTVAPSPTVDAIPAEAVLSQPGSSDLSAAEQEYLRGVEESERLMIAVFRGFGQIFSQTYPVREALVSALLEGGIGTPFVGKFAALEALDPPERFREDHRIWLEATRESLRVDTEAAQAVRDKDLAKFAHLNGRLAEINAGARLALSHVFCLSAGVQGPESLLCRPEVSVLDGEYEIGVDGLLRDFLPSFASTRSTVGFPLSLSTEELDRLLAESAASALKSFQEAGSALGAFTPPDEMRADHERLQSFVGGMVGIIQEVNRLREEGNIDGARGELQRLELVFCSARASFESADFKEVVRVLFVGDPRTCGGTPF